MEESINITDLSQASSLEIARKIIEVLNAKDAQSIKLLHVEDNTVISDYFVICTGNSNTQIKAFSGDIEYKLGLCGVPARTIEGYNEASWVAMDYGTVIVHIFNRETRTFYNLDKLWSDSTDVNISDLITTK